MRSTVRFIDDPKHWRSRAAKMRMLADEMSDESARTMMLKLADDYDELGDRAEERGSKGPQPAQSWLHALAEIVLLSGRG
jgi:hypothetical protein